MRVALISDLHANVVSLQAVLDDIKHVGVDRIVCLGDVATLGPDPRTIVGMLDHLGCPVIMGNHDEFLLDPALIRTYTEAPIVMEAVDWCRDQFNQNELNYVRGFHRTLEIELDANASLFLFHGSPSSHMQDLLATTPPDELEKLLGAHRATVMAGGHTHIQMLRQHRGTLLLNPGSVGLPFREYVAGRPPTLMTHAEYATVESTKGSVSVNLRRVAVDRDKLREGAGATSHPMRAMLIQQYS